MLLHPTTKTHENEFSRISLSSRKCARLLDKPSAALLKVEGSLFASTQVQCRMQQRLPRSPSELRLIWHY
eukprot:6205682-Amphidinium_carterae.1